MIEAAPINFRKTGRCYATDCVRRRRLAFLLRFSRNPYSALTVSQPFQTYLAKGMTEQSVAVGPEVITQVIAGAHQQLLFEEYLLESTLTS
mgnify:CR=1 FL=1